MTTKLKRYLHEKTGMIGYYYVVEEDHPSIEEVELIGYFSPEEVKEDEAKRERDEEVTP